MAPILSRPQYVNSTATATGIIQANCAVLCLLRFGLGHCFVLKVTSYFTSTRSSIIRLSQSQWSIPGEYGYIFIYIYIYLMRPLTHRPMGIWIWFQMYKFQIVVITSMSIFSVLAVRSMVQEPAYDESTLVHLRQQLIYLIQCWLKSVTRTQWV